jgi:hypothetical protein
MVSRIPVSAGQEEGGGDDFSKLTKQRNVVVTTYNRDRTAVPTAVNSVVKQGRLVPWVRRFRHYQTVHYGLTARPSAPD